MFFKKIRFVIEYCVATFVLFIFHFLPDAWIWKSAKFLGRAGFYISKKRREIALKNLRMVYGDSLSDSEIINLAICSFEHAVLSIAELFFIDRILEKAPKAIRYKGLEHLDQALEKGKGIILLVSHAGSWELLGLLGRKIPLATVVKEIRNPLINQRINEYRKLGGNLPLEKRNSAREVLRWLGKNQMVAILVDQWAGPEGIPAKFFGRMTSTTSLPLRLAKASRAVIVAGFCIRTGLGEFEIQLEPAVKYDRTDKEEEQAVTDRLNKIVEAKIREYPAQWTWGHRRWKDMPERMRSAY